MHKLFRCLVKPSLTKARRTKVVRTPLSPSDPQNDPRAQAMPAPDSGTPRFKSTKPTLPSPPSWLISCAASSSLLEPRAASPLPSVAHGSSRLEPLAQAFHPLYKGYFGAALRAPPTRRTACRHYLCDTGRKQPTNLYFFSSITPNPTSRYSAGLKLGTSTLLHTLHDLSPPRRLLLCRHWLTRYLAGAVTKPCNCRSCPIPSTRSMQQVSSCPANTLPGIS